MFISKSLLIIILLFCSIIPLYSDNSKIKKYLLFKKNNKLGLAIYKYVKTSKLPFKTIGHSVLGYDISMYKRGNRGDLTVIFAGFHGDEPVGCQLVIRLVEYLHYRRKDIFKKHRVIFIPIVNPDGLFKAIRTNIRGVDINRNFPTKNWRPTSKKSKYHPGSSPASEPETKIILDLLKKYPPDKIVTIHSPLYMINYDGPAKPLAQLMSKLSGYRLSADIGYPTPGSFGTYYGSERNIPVVNIELPYITINRAWRDNYKALITAITYPIKKKSLHNPKIKKSKLSPIKR